MITENLKSKKGGAWRNVTSLALLSLLSVSVSSCVLTEEDKELISSLFEGPEGPAEPPHPTIGPRCYNTRFQQPEGELVKKLDLLFVTDTSGSLAEERQAIANGIDSFVAQLPGDVDLRTSVLLAHGPSSNWHGKPYRKGSEPEILDNQIHSMSNIRNWLRQKLANPAGDWNTDGGEVGLFALASTLYTPSKLNNFESRGFFRPDAALAVVYVADENDICYPGQVFDTERLETPAYNNLCGANSVHPQITGEYVNMLLRNLKGEMPLAIAGIVYNNPATVQSVGENEIGLGYLDSIERSGGIAVDLASGDYNAGLAQIGQLTYFRLQNLINVVTLAQQNVDVATIRVLVDGVPAQFTYNPAANEVTITNPGSPLSTVDVNYCLLPETGGGSGSGCTGIGCGGGGIGV